MFTRPEPKQIVKLSAQKYAIDLYQWRGRLRGGGADVFLQRSWVRKNFKAYGRWLEPLSLPHGCSRRY